MKMPSRMIHSDVLTHLCGAVQHGIPKRTGAQILWGRNCNGMVLILTREQLELMAVDWMSDLLRKAEADAVGT